MLYAYDEQGTIMVEDNDAFSVVMWELKLLGDLSND